MSELGQSLPPRDVRTTSAIQPIAAAEAPMDPRGPKRTLLLEHVVFSRNRDSQRGRFLIQTPCWVLGASMDDATLFGGYSRTRSCTG